MKRFMAFFHLSGRYIIMLGAMAADDFGLAAALSSTYLVYVVSNWRVCRYHHYRGECRKWNMDDYNVFTKPIPWLSFRNDWRCSLAVFLLCRILFQQDSYLHFSVTGSSFLALYMLVLVALINTIISLHYTFRL